MVNFVKRPPVKRADEFADVAGEIADRITEKIPGDLRAPQQAISKLIDRLAGVSTGRLLVAYSGGLDSHVLLHCLSQALASVPNAADTSSKNHMAVSDPAAIVNSRLLAVHINHNLQSESHDWATHCTRTANLLGIKCQVHHVKHDDEFSQELKRSGPEAAARSARYKAFAEQMNAGDYLLLAQHADDQAETFLLQALRGSGPGGLAAMPAQREFAHGLLLRPFLECLRMDLEAYAQHFGLVSIEDPTNADERFDRNFIRQQIMPRLTQRWPAAKRTLSRTATHSAAASSVLNELAHDDLTVMLDDQATSDSLDVDALLSLSVERRFNVLRCWIHSNGLLMPPTALLQQIEQELLQNPTSAGTARTRGYELRRYRDRLYLLHPPVLLCTAFEHTWPDGQGELAIPEIGLSLSRADLAAQGLSLPTNARIKVRSRDGGERLAVGRPVMHKSVKKLMQEAGLPPWQRSLVPLIYVNDELAAVWKIAVSSRHKKDEG